MHSALLYRGARYRLALPYVDEGFVGQRWGRQGSGLILTTGDRILLLHRSAWVEEPGTWGVPGGAVPVDTKTGQPKDVFQSCLHEAEEEMGSVPPHRIIDHYLYGEPSGFQYTTFIGLVSPEVVDSWHPTLNWENDAYRWVGLDELTSLNLHFGVVEVLRHKRRVLFPHRHPDQRVAAALQVVDLRDPNYEPTPDSSYGFTDKQEIVEAQIAVGKTKIFLYNYADHNTLKWTDLLDTLRQDGSEGPFSDSAAVLTKTGNLLLDAGHGWGSRSRFSPTIEQRVRPIYEAGLVKPEAEVWIGNTAGLRGRKIGTVQEFMEKLNIQLPDRLVLYHGTSNIVAETILKEGLKAQPVHKRVWHRDVLSRHPDWRGDAVYLTVDLYQAHYYATKAVNVLRRHGYRGVHPAVLKIVVPKSHFDKFMPDDDYLAKVLGKGKPDVRQLNLFHDLSWLGSLGEMSQVAYLGSIPSEWISVESRLSKHEYQDPKIASIRYRGALYRSVA